MTEFQAHLDTGTTKLARCWAVLRRDGTTYGFTDQDCPVAFGGICVGGGGGVSARAVSTATGMGVDNSGVMGAVGGAAITEAGY